jgi:hypothetical protein
MNKIFSIFVITLLQSSISLAQGIGEVSIEPKNPSLNQPFKITINSNGDTPSCGLQINLGDGNTRDVRVEKFPVVVDHTYAKEGNFAIAVNGKLIMRGLRSSLPCGGETKTLAVGIGSQTVNIVATQPTSQSTANIPNQSEQLAKQNQTSKQIDFYADHKKNQRPIWVNKYFDAFTENVSPIIKNCPLNDTWKEAATINKNLEIDKNLLQIQIVYKDIQNNIVQDPNFNRLKQDCKDKVKVAITFLDTNKPDEIQKKYKSDLDDFNKFALSQQQEQQRQDAARVAVTEQSEIKDAYTKGMVFAKESGVKWILTERKDPMSGKIDRLAKLESKSESGASLISELTCVPVANEKNLTAIVHKHTLSKGIVPSHRDGNRYSNVGRQRINEKVTEMFWLQDAKFNNVWSGNILTQDAIFAFVENGIAFKEVGGKKTFLYDLMYELSTNMGPVFIKMPPYDNAINALIRSCKPQ